MGDIEINVEDEKDIEINIEEEFRTKSFSMGEANIRLEWYKFSERFVTEEYKVKYVHPDAEETNKKKVFDWYDKCCDIGLVPDEFKINDEEEEPKEEINKNSKKSFHKQRKEEWKKRKSSKNVFEVSEDKKEKENKKEHVFSGNRTRPPSFKLPLFTMIAIYLLGFVTANQNGYRP